MTEKKKFIKKYEWVGDVDTYKEPEANEHSVKYNEPNRDYDSEYKPTKKDIETFKGSICWILFKLVYMLVYIK